MSSLDAARAKLFEEAKIDVRSKFLHIDNEARIREVARSFQYTITVPTKEMLGYATLASLGDDVYHEPSTHALETHVAQLTGKEAGLFVASGTMANQIAVRTHLKQPPYSMLCDARSHIYLYETGGAAFHSGAFSIGLLPKNGHHLTLSDIQENIIQGTDVHFAPTELIALENTLNGTIIPQDDVLAISSFAHSQGIDMHLDGARIWHVAAETGTPLKELCDPFDSVSLCFSKGLGAPVGSCLVGSKAFIDKARRFRKLFGGGMRQTGSLAAYSAYALTHNFPLLPVVHALTKRLENGLEEIGVEITSRAETCMIFYNPSPLGLDCDEIADRANDLPDPIILQGSRLVVHIQTSEDAIDDFLALVRTLAEEKKSIGGVLPERKTAQVNKNPYAEILR